MKLPGCRIILLTALSLGTIATTAVRAQTPMARAVAATVNGETITVGEIEAILAKRPPSVTVLSAAQQRQMRHEILSGLIDDLLVRQFLRQHGAKIDPAEVETQITELKASLKAQGKTIEDFLKETQQTEAELRTNAMMMLQMAAHLRNACKQADLKAYFDANKDYFDKVTVRASHIVIRVSPEAISERTEARKRLEQLREQIVAGKIAFADAAKANSQCPSATKGGDLGYFTRKWMFDEAFASAAFALKPGEISMPVDSEFGVHLIQVTDRSKGTPAMYESSLEEIRDCYMEEVRQALMMDLRKKAKVSIQLP